jgi:uncharacterized membrane protein YccC
MLVAALRSASFVLTTASLALAMGAGCIVVNATAPDMHGDPGPPRPPVATAPAVRYKPYAAALDRVLRQQADVENELRKRDWEDLREEVEDWQKNIRRLVGAADTSHDPARLRELCGQLLTRLDTMHRAARGQDAATVEKALDDAAPILNRLSSEFPLTEPTTRPVTEASQ